MALLLEAATIVDKALKPQNKKRLPWLLIDVVC
jgi:hypothetical protein